ncbi:prepilin-type N-terminal cleavage/methylation domain-containing protein [Ruficoccus sp. ZRK36]|uniref:prepilin-type N-terminal cleavage/methylation domain-containing protein n=1 Tax=Ruficoccus sp. ZRK36 TaxID=2866311 RepID=UPI001C73904D|nr:prepilin-type N-terminal cleavage/methylation domain-containing protein [Ruficoccus sp. ZRK36]QYY37053.1 type II secretion system GspH family protein [Ruficoccus sp. ZRK36]
MKHTPMQTPKRRPAFTLIELLVVMGVILVLAGIVVGVQRGVYHQQAQARAKADLHTIANAMETFKLKYGDYPWIRDDEGDLFKVLTGQLVLRRGGANQTGDYGMYAPVGDVEPLLDETLIDTAENAAGETYFVDPWGTEYRYYYKTEARPTNPWASAGFILISLGPGGTTSPEPNIYNGFESGSLPGPSVYYADPEDDEFDDVVYGLDPL